jgi:hypothetical protein
LWTTHEQPELDIGEAVGVRFSDHIDQRQVSNKKNLNQGHTMVARTGPNSLDLQVDILGDTFETPAANLHAETARSFLQEQLARTSKKVEPIIVEREGTTRTFLCLLCREHDTATEEDKNKEWRSRSQLLRHQDGTFHVPNTRWYRQMKRDYPNNDFQCQYLACPRKGEVF